MPSRIEDYALIGDCHTAALVGKDGSIDWLCLPYFDSPACFAALLGNPDHGRWRLAPVEEVRQVRRRYRPGTLILETEFETDSGTAVLIDFMPAPAQRADLVRIVVGQRGQVRMRMELAFRFDYGSIVPWLQRTERGISAIAGPDLVQLETDVETHGENFVTVAEFTVSDGQRVPFVLTWSPSHHPETTGLDPEAALDRTERWWREWSDRCRCPGEWADAVKSSLIVLKAMTYAPTGAIAAAPTTSLPVRLGGDRNWDYRYCWLRDATFTLLALLNAGYAEEANAWRSWLLRAAAGKPSELRIMYGLRGERRLTELTIPWLPGYEGAKPVRIGNGAFLQRQLDVYGEVMDAMHQALKAGIGPNQAGWRLEKALLDFLESNWRDPDDGIWELRGDRQHYTHSKVMAWVAFDRAVKSAESFGLDGPVERWKAIRGQIHEQVCRDGFNPRINAFAQWYGSNRVDASLLMIPLVGFLPATDPRMRGTVECIERTLITDGYVARYELLPEYHPTSTGESAFLLCNFWLADNYALMGRLDDARGAFQRMLDLRNDVGLLSESYDPSLKRMAGNFPQAFSHVGLVNTALNLSRGAAGPAEQRPQT